MQMTSTGKERRHPGKEIVHFTHTDKTGSFSSAGGDSPSTRRWMEGDRKYRIILTPDDVIKCLFDLPLDSIADAVSANFSDRLPDVVKQLVKGAMNKKGK